MAMVLGWYYVELMTTTNFTFTIYIFPRFLEKASRGKLNLGVVSDRGRLGPEGKTGAPRMP
jgi:hypothetical protein